MIHDKMFDRLSVSSLDQIANYLGWDPFVTESPIGSLSSLPERERLRWLDRHRSDLEEHISWVGTPIITYMLGGRRGYKEIVQDIAEQFQIANPGTFSTAELEKILLNKLWNDTLSRLKPEEKQELMSRIEASASRYKTSMGKEFAGFAALSAAQMSGFGVYILGSTLLGALNSALGLGLSFGAFTGLSSLISVVIGPIGWAALGLHTIRKLGAPNYKKLLPIIIVIAVDRAEAAGAATGELQPALPTVSPRRDRPLPGQVEETTKPSIIRSYEVNEIKRDIEEISRTARVVSRKPKPHPAAFIYIPTRADKRNFDLRPQNGEICDVVRSLDSSRHFLEMSHDDQEAIKQLVEERRLMREEEKRAAEKEQRKLRKQEEQARKADRKEDSKRQAGIKKLQRRYGNLLRNLEFEQIALDRIYRLDDSQVVRIEGELGIINEGKCLYRDSITGTDPKVYEIRAGWDFRIYLSRNGSKTTIRLIGDKGTQESDIALLKDRS